MALAEITNRPPPKSKSSASMTKAPLASGGSNDHQACRGAGPDAGVSTSAGTVRAEAAISASERATPQTSVSSSTAATFRPAQQASEPIRKVLADGV